MLRQLPHILKTAGLALGLLAMSTICSVPVAQERQEVTLDQALAISRELVSNGNFFEALEILEVLQPELPNNDSVQFLTGIAALNASHAEHLSLEEKRELLQLAIRNFHSMLARNPSLTRVRLELARSFFLNEQDILAKRHFETVLASDVHPNVAANIRRFLNVIEARRRWTTHFGFALAPDTNVNSVPEDRAIFISLFPGAPPLRFEGEPTKSGVGIKVWGGGEYNFPIGERTRLRVGTSLSRTEYPSHEFDSTSIEAYAGPKWRIGNSSDFSLLASVRRQISGGGTSYSYAGIRTEWSRRMSDKLSLSSNFSYYHKAATGSSAKGPTKSISLTANYFIRPTMRLALTVGEADERQLGSLRNSYKQPNADLSFTYATPLGVTMSIGANYSKTNYKGPWIQFTPEDVPRKDETVEYRASIFRPGYTMAGFSPRLEYVYSRRESNAQGGDFKRKRVEFSFVRQF